MSQQLHDTDHIGIEFEEQDHGIAKVIVEYRHDDGETKTDSIMVPRHMRDDVAEALRTDD